MILFKFKKKDTANFNAFSLDLLGRQTRSLCPKKDNPVFTVCHERFSLLI